MRDENHIRTLGDSSKPSHEGYRNTIDLRVGNNVVTLRSDTIWLVQNGCSFHGLRSEDPNQHLKDFLKLVDSLDLDGENRERMRLRLFQFSLRDQASNWLERLPAGSITTWEDLTTRFLAQFFPPGGTAKLHNDILMFQQHHGESLFEAWTRFKDLLQKFPHHGIDLWLQVQIFYDHVNPVTRRTIDQSAGGKLRDRNAKESCALLEDLALYDNDTKVGTTKGFCEENEVEEECSVEPSKTNYTNRKNANETDEEVKSEKEVEEETERETEEEEDNPEHFDTFPTMKELRLEPRSKPSNPKKNCNFVGRVKGLRVFVRNFTYECDFMVLEDTTSVIDHYLGSGRSDDDDNVKNTHYSDSLDLGLEYKYDEYVCRGIRSLIAANPGGRTKEKSRNRYQQKDKNKAKTDKTEHKIGKSMEKQSQKHQYNSSYLDDSLPELETFSFDIEGRVGGVTISLDYSLPIDENCDKSDSVFEKFDDELAHIISPSEYDCYYFDIEPDLGELTKVVVEDIFGEPRVHMPNVLTTLPTLYLDLDFTLSTDFSGSDHVVSFHSEIETRPS
ncbi:zinc finger, CCHC-type containing protein [Tanacetum coccineum]